MKVIAWSSALVLLIAAGAAFLRLCAVCSRINEEHVAAGKTHEEEPPLEAAGSPQRGQ